MCKVKMKENQIQRNNLKVSVIIPMYNVSEYIERCILSVLNNTFKNLEIVLIDDGSTDDTLAIVTKIQRNDKRIKLIHQENAGVSAARNVGLDSATGDYICFVDSDDWLDINFFENLVDLIIKHNCDIVCCEHIDVYSHSDAYNTDNTCDSVNIRCGHDLLKLKAKGYIWGKIYKKSIINNNRFELGAKIAEDDLFNTEILADNLNCVCVFSGIPLYYYFRRSDSAVRSFSGSSLYPVVNRLFNDFENADEFKKKSIFLLECIKKALAGRYLSKYSFEGKDQCNKFKLILKKALNGLNKLPTVSFKEKLIYSSFIRFPFLYRAYRIAGDKTLLTWERNQKKN